MHQTWGIRKNIIITSNQPNKTGKQAKKKHILRLEKKWICLCVDEFLNHKEIRRFEQLETHRWEIGRKWRRRKWRWERIAGGSGLLRPSPLGSLSLSLGCRKEFRPFMWTFDKDTEEEGYLGWFFFFIFSSFLFSTSPTSALFARLLSFWVLKGWSQDGSKKN